MRHMSKVLAVVAILCLTVGAATAAKPEGKPTNLTRGLLDCSAAISIDCNTVVSGTNVGATNNVEAYSCVGWNEAGGEVVYELTTTTDMEITVGLSNMSCDLDVFFLGSCEESDCLYYGNASFTTSCLAAGTYYIVVDGYSGAECTYDLSVDCVTCEPPPPPPDNDDCDGAIDLFAQGMQDFYVDLTLYTNVYNLVYPSCTGYSTPGPEAVYVVTLLPGETITVREEGACDMALYMVTDCSDPDGTCVVGSDNCCTGATEVITYTSTEGGTYYVMVDAYSSAGCEVHVVIEDIIKAEEATWGTLKSLYR